MIRVGILALQGAFAEHAQSLYRINEEAGGNVCESFLIRQKRDIEKEFDGLILPGGESTVMGKLLRETGLFAPLKDKIDGGLATFGTCAGLILLAEEIVGEEPYFASLSVKVRRNAYGRQIDSFSGNAVVSEVSKEEVPLVFIRAPWIEEVKKTAGKPEVRVLNEIDGHITAVRQGNILGTSFHPELTDNTAFHKYFLDMCKS